jgi:hypothetical protein
VIFKNFCTFQLAMSNPHFSAYGSQAANNLRTTPRDPLTKYPAVIYVPPDDESSGDTLRLQGSGVDPRLQRQKSELRKLQKEFGVSYNGGEGKRSVQFENENSDGMQAFWLHEENFDNQSRQSNSLQELEARRSRLSASIEYTKKAKDHRQSSGLEEYSSTSDRFAVPPSNTIEMLHSQIQNLRSQIKRHCPPSTADAAIDSDTVDAGLSPIGSVEELWPREKPAFSAGYGSMQSEAAFRQMHTTGRNRENDHDNDNEYQRAMDAAGRKPLVRGAMGEEGEFLATLHRLKQESASSMKTVERIYFETIKNGKHLSSAEKARTFAMLEKLRGKSEAHHPAMEEKFRNLVQHFYTESDPIKAHAETSLDSDHVASHNQRGRPASARSYRALSPASSITSSSSTSNQLPTRRRSASVCSSRESSGAKERKLVAFGRTSNPEFAAGVHARKSKWKPKITIPTPFEFDARESSKPKSIAQKRLEEDLALKKALDEAHERMQFKANPVPPNTLVPRFQQIQRDNERRRQEVKTKSVEITKQREKPFSFYARDVAKKMEKMRAASPLPQFEQFKANPIPTDLSEPVMDMLRRQDAERKQRVLRRAQDTLMKSALPPRMEMWEKTEGVKKKALLEEREKMAFLTEEHTFKPNIHTDVPDFQKLQQQFEAQLQKRKGAHQPVQAVGFNFRVDSMDSSEKIREDINKDEETLPEMRWPYISKRVAPEKSQIDSTAPPTHAPKSTLTQELRNQVVRKSLEERRIQEENVLRLEKERGSRQRAMKAKIQPKLTSNKAEMNRVAKENREKFVQDAKARVRQYHKDMDDMKSRVQSRPFLFEQSLKEKAKQRARAKFERILEEAGVDPDNFMSDEEDESVDGNEGI